MIANNFKDTVIFLLYILFLYIILYENVDSMSSTNYNHVNDMIKLSDGNSIDLEDIRNIEEWVATFLIYLVQTSALERIKGSFTF